MCTKIHLVQENCVWKTAAQILQVKGLNILTGLHTANQSQCRRRDCETPHFSFLLAALSKTLPLAQAPTIRRAHSLSRSLPTSPAHCAVSHLAFPMLHRERRSSRTSGSVRRKKYRAAVIGERGRDEGVISCVLRQGRRFILATWAAMMCAIAWHRSRERCDKRALWYSRTCSTQWDLFDTIPQRFISSWYLHFLFLNVSVNCVLYRLLGQHCITSAVIVFMIRAPFTVSVVGIHIPHSCMWCFVHR